MTDKKSEIGLVWAPKIPTLFGGAKNSSMMLQTQTKDSTSNPSNKLVDGLYVPPRDPRNLKKLLKKNTKDTAGGSWFDMPAPTITPELKRDLEILKLRHVIDPKKHFKKGDQAKGLPKYFQVGTVVEPASEFFSGRLTKKERKATLVDELLHDNDLKTYRKRKVREIDESNRPRSVEMWKIKGKKPMRANHRRK